MSVNICISSLNGVEMKRKTIAKGRNRKTRTEEDKKRERTRRETLDSSTEKQSENGTIKS